MRNTGGSPSELIRIIRALEQRVELAENQLSQFIRNNVFQIPSLPEVEGIIQVGGTEPIANAGSPAFWFDTSSLPWRAYAKQRSGAVHGNAYEYVQMSKGRT